MLYPIHLTKPTKLKGLFFAYRVNEHNSMLTPDVKLLVGVFTKQKVGKKLCSIKILAKSMRANVVIKPLLVCTLCS